MERPRFVPREGGVTIVFDVAAAIVPEVTRAVTAAGFVVRPYYRPGDEPRVGGARPGLVRLGAERPTTEFTDSEAARIVAAFDAVQRASGFDCERVGVDSWTAGGDGPAGDREPRRPLPTAGAGPAFARPGPPPNRIGLLR